MTPRSPSTGADEKRADELGLPSGQPEQIVYVQLLRTTTTEIYATPAENECFRPRNRRMPQAVLLRTLINYCSPQQPKLTEPPRLEIRPLQGWSSRPPFYFVYRKGSFSAKLPAHLFSTVLPRRSTMKQATERRPNARTEEFSTTHVRLGIFFLMILLRRRSAFVPLMAERSYHLMITEHDYYNEKAIKNQTRSTNLTAARGVIYDANMQRSSLVIDCRDGLYRPERDSPSR